MSAPITTNVPRPLSLDERNDLENELASLETVLNLTDEETWSFEAVERHVNEIRALLKDGAR